MGCQGSGGGLASEILARTGGNSDLLIGEITALAATSATLNVNGGLLTVLPLDHYAPAVGDVAVVLRQGGRVYAIGSIGTHQPTTGTVVAPVTAGQPVNVSTSQGTLSLSYLASYTPTLGHLVYIGWLSGTGVVLGRQGVTPVPPPPPPTPPPPVVVDPPPPPSGTVSTFPATQGRSYRVGGGWQTTGEVLQGPDNIQGYSGAWFYGSALTNTLSGATVVTAQIYLHRLSGEPHWPLVLQRHTSGTKPATANVTYAGATQSVTIENGEKGWFTLPTALAQALVDSGGGVGLPMVPIGNFLIRTAALATTPTAGTIRITWRL